MKIALRNSQTGVRDGAVIEMKVTPATGTYPVRNAAGNWVDS